MIYVRVLSEEDFCFATRLTDTVDWGLTEEDFQFMIDLEPHGCFIVLDGEKKIGIATTVTYGEVGWIGNVIVEEKYRNRGVGSRLLMHAMNYLRKRAVKTINLLSYVHAIPFYENLGFKSVGWFSVLKGKGTQRKSAGRVRSAGEKDFPDIFALDAFCFGTSRERVLRRILSEKDNLCCTSYADDELSGFIFARRYPEMAELGPMACRSNSVNAIDLLHAILGELLGLEVHMYVAEKAVSLLAELKTLGFEERFKVMKMFWGRPVLETDCLLAAESLERG